MYSHLLNIFSIYIVTPFIWYLFYFCFNVITIKLFRFDKMMIFLNFYLDKLYIQQYYGQFNNNDKRSIKVKMVVNLISMANKITKMGNNSLTKTNKVTWILYQQNPNFHEIMDTKVIIIKPRDILTWSIWKPINPNFQGQQNQGKSKWPRPQQPNHHDTKIKVKTQTNPNGPRPQILNLVNEIKGCKSKSRSKLNDQDHNNN